MHECELYEDAYYPITAEIVFARSAPRLVADSLADWLATTKHPGRHWEVTESSDASLEESILGLLPLQRVEVSKYLIVSVNDGWSAVFTNRWRVSSLSGEAGALAGYTRAQCLVVGYTTGAARIDGRGLGTYGYVKFEVFRYDLELGHSRKIRSLLSLHDSKKWFFDTVSDALPFEDAGAYQRPRTKDRFGCNELVKYLDAYSISAFDPRAYDASSAFRLTRISKYDNDEDVSVMEVQGSWRAYGR